MRLRNILFGVLFGILATASFLPTAAAQDGCDETEPCLWVVEISADGLAAPGGDLEGTVGDWHVFEFTNLDPDQDHTLTYSATGEEWTVPALTEGQRSQPFQLAAEGTFTLADNVTGDTLAVHVILDDVTDDGTSAGATDDGQGAPGLPLALAAAAVAAVAWARRR